MQSDLTGVSDRWIAHLGDIAEQVAKLPDGDSRLDAFAEQMLAASDPYAFMMREAQAAEGGLIGHLLPGPVAVQFLSDLREAVRAKGGSTSLRHIL